MLQYSPFVSLFTSVFPHFSSFYIFSLLLSSPYFLSVSLSIFLQFSHYSHSLLTIHLSHYIFLFSHFPFSPYSSRSLHFYIYHVRLSYRSIHNSSFLSLTLHLFLFVYRSLFLLSLRLFIISNFIVFLCSHY